MKRFKRGQKRPSRANINIRNSVKKVKHYFYYSPFEPEDLTKKGKRSETMGLFRGPTHPQRNKTIEYYLQLTFRVIASLFKKNFFFYFAAVLRYQLYFLERKQGGKWLNKFAKLRGSTPYMILGSEGENAAV